TTNNDPGTGTSPSARAQAGWAFSRADNIFLLWGGCQGATTLTDIWAWHPDTANWESLCASACWTVNNAGTPTFEDLAYDADDNVFLVLEKGNGTSDYT